MAIVCHSPAALRHVKTPDGKPLVEGNEVTGFTNGEEEAVGLTKVVPFLVEDEMLRLGATFSKRANWTPLVVSNGLLITGQNPHSSGPTANAPLAALKGKPIARDPGSRLVQYALCRPEIGGLEPARPVQWFRAVPERWPALSRVGAGLREYLTNCTNRASCDELPHT